VAFEAVTHGDERRHLEVLQLAVGKARDMGTVGGTLT
jgi:hypothetical protein